MKRALEEPLRQIAANAGCEGSVVVKEALGSSDRGIVMVGLRCVQESRISTAHPELMRLAKN